MMRLFSCKTGRQTTELWATGLWTTGGNLDLRRWRQAACLGLALGALAGLSPATAQQTPADPAQAEELLEVERALEDAAVQKDAAHTQARAAQRAALHLQRQLVAAGDRTQALEARITRTQDHLKGLVAARAVSAALLAARREQLVESLAALQRLDLDPPPALLVNPQDALAAARGAMLLGTLVPELKTVAESLAEQIQALDDLAHTIERERTQLAEDAAALAAERRRIDALLIAKRAEQQALSQEAERATRAHAELAARARSLRELLGGLEGDVPTFAALRPGFTFESQAPPAFSTLKGRLRAPAVGRITKHFGSDDGPGSVAQGITLQAAPGAQVVSPADASTVFAGPFRSYGNVLIITPADTYLIVIAGLAEIYATPGQNLLAGEPVGRLYDADGADGDARQAPLLYIEMRKDGIPVDPAPWIRFQARPA